MGFNSVSRQWDYVIGEFNSAITSHQTAIAQKISEGCEVEAFDCIWLQVLKSGRSQAKNRQRIARVMFWKSSSFSARRVLADFLEELKNQTKDNSSVQGELLSRKALESLKAWSAIVRLEMKYGAGAGNIPNHIAA